MPTAPRVSVVIGAYDAAATIGGCLEALRRQTFRDFEVVLVDSSPDEETARIAAAYPKVVFERSASRLYCHEARNRAIGRARGELLACLDADVYPRPEWLAELVAAYERTGGLRGDGLWAAASPKYAHLLAGAGAADSWVTDGHKWLNDPFDCAYAFVANRDAPYGSMSHRASYLTHDALARDAGDWTPEWSRRARSFPTYAALRFLGRSGLADLVERCCRHAYEIVTRIGELPGAEVLAISIINQGLLRFGDRTDAVIAAINATGEAFFSGTTWRRRARDARERRELEDDRRRRRPCRGCSRERASLTVILCLRCGSRAASRCFSSRSRSWLTSGISRSAIRT